MTKEEKQQAHEMLLRKMDNRFIDHMTAIDHRLYEYFCNLADEPNMHNGYEILGGGKFIRLDNTYDFNEKRVQQIIKLREGEWQQDERGRWHHVRGGIKCPGTDTAHVYRWQPFQVFVLASVFGFHTWFNTEVRAIDKPELLLTEREREDGFVEDFRRLCNYFVLYTPRKTDKTGMSAYIQVVFFLMGDYNSEIYCCANAEFQSRILYGRTTFMLNDADTKKRFDMNSKRIAWKPKFHSVRNAMIMPLTAGGKTKDGPFAELVNWDELGSSEYTNGKSNMMSLVNVMRSSMGPRREGLTFGTTTAGTIKSGPFIDMLQGLHHNLLLELKFDSGEEQPTLSGDRQLCLLLEPDDWEKYDEQLLLNSKELRRKINPMLGITCQHQFYEDSISDMYNGKMTREELFSKLFNVYESATTQEWIKPEVIRGLQNDKTIDDYTAKGGWVIFTGLDFSQGDDLHTAGYLAARKHHSGQGYELFADFDAWIKQDVLEKSSIRPLYEEWIQKGWLHVSPGAVFQPSLFVQRFDELLQKGCQFQYFGYDPYQSKDPINTLKAYLQEKGVAQPEKHVLPVSQRNAWFNAPTDDLARAIKSPIPYITFSANPMWPWLFGNCVLSIDGRGGSSAEMDLSNKKPVKRAPGSDSCKVDPIQTICIGMGLMTQFEGQNH